MSENDSNTTNIYRQQLMFLSQQKQQLQFQISVLENTLKELEKTKEEKVYKGVGNIFIYSDKSEVLKETKDLKDTLDLKLKNIIKQEETLLKKISTTTKPKETEQTTHKGVQ